MWKQLSAGLCGSPGHRGKLDPWPFPSPGRQVYRNIAKMLWQKSLQRSQRVLCQMLEGGQGSERPQRSSILQVGLWRQFTKQRRLGEHSRL